MSVMNNNAAEAATLRLFAGAMPKQEIGAVEFLKAHPEYDGRGVIIAIFDTGVDPGTTGLQVTTDGKPKIPTSLPEQILDVLDGTGSGDVDTTTVVRADDDGCIVGLHDTKLRLNPEWANPSGEWHVGVKRAFDLFPSGLQARIKRERRKKFDEEHAGAVAAATRELHALTQGAKADGAGKEEKEEAGEEERRKAELEARVRLLGEAAEKYTDLGPLIHCVVWHDGENNRVALDTSDMHPPGSGEGALADFLPLTDFHIERQYATFTAVDACNFGVHVYEECNLLSIVVDSGMHGTHVAGIAAAHHPDDPDLNGIAPGAQIVSCKIGDSRLDGMETIVGLSRALGAVLAHGCHLINLSYGEATATPNAGRFIQLANEVVHKHGVIFVSSAGNAGPALSTVGAPGGTTSSIISVGAFVSPNFASVGHSVRGGFDEVAGMMGDGRQYNWSSRGPTPDGTKISGVWCYGE